jgi:hypothetical protein
VAAFLEKPVEDTVLLAAIDHALAAAELASAVAGPLCSEASLRPPGEWHSASRRQGGSCHEHDVWS